MTQEQIEANLAMIKGELESELENSTIIGLVEEKLIRISNVMGLSAECMRYAKKLCGNRQQVLMNTSVVKTMSPSVLKLWMEGEMSYEMSLFLYSDRLNAALVHCADTLRTIISKYKEELRMESYSSNSKA